MFTCDSHIIATDVLYVESLYALINETALRKTLQNACSVQEKGHHLKCSADLMNAIWFFVEPSDVTHVQGSRSQKVTLFYFCSGSLIDAIL